MQTDDQWLMLLYLGFPWLSAYLHSGLISVTGLAIRKKPDPEEPLTPRSGCYRSWLGIIDDQTE